MSLQSLHNLKKELTVFLLSLLITSTLYIITDTWRQSALNNKDLQQMDLQEAKQRYFNALDARQLLKDFETKFKALKQQHIIGDENRLNWVDSIEKITVKYQIPYLKYQIEQRNPLNTPSLAAKYPGITVYQSLMSLDMQLLHEGDLYAVINNLHRDANGLFDIKQCSITKNENSSQSLLESSTDRNFTALCTLGWYTFEQQTVETFIDDMAMDESQL